MYTSSVADAAQTVKLDPPPKLTASNPHVILTIRMHVSRVLTNLLYPPACLLCHGPLPARAPHEGSALEIVCEACQDAMPRSGPPVCVRCGMTLPGAFDAALCCAFCRSTPPIFEMARAPWQYAGSAQRAIHQFKYDRRWRLGRWLSADMAASARASLPLARITAVVPVPLHWLKHRMRGFNPAEALAVSVADQLNKPCLPRALRRTRWTPSQTRLHGRKRLQNVRGAFTADPRMVRGEGMLLIDDVHTSGATVNACAGALNAAGARHVFVLTAARTPIL